MVGEKDDGGREDERARGQEGEEEERRGVREREEMGTCLMGDMETRKRKEREGKEREREERKEREGKGREREEREREGKGDTPACFSHISLALSRSLHSSAQRVQWSV